MRCSVIQYFVSFVGLLYLQETMAQLLEPQCGLTGIADKIMGGANAIHGANPWMAYLYKGENDFQCGGSLIHKTAHCIVIGETLAVRLGEYYSASRSSTSTVYNVTMAMRNRLFPNVAYEHDIGMLKLDPEVQFNDNIRPICIFTDASQAPSVSSYTVTGWGSTRRRRKAKQLQTLELKEEAPENCYEHLGQQLIQGQICAGHPTGDTCLGDSGSPLGHHVNISGLMRYAQFGLVSYGHLSCISPGIYTKVTFYADWIVKAVEFGLSY